MTELKTISELMEGKKPGEIRIRDERWAIHSWFRPFFRANDKWYGLTMDGTFDWNSDNYSVWTLYTEPKPKKKVVMYRYLYRDKGTDRLVIIDHMNEEYFKFHYDNLGRDCKRLDDSRWELEVEDE